MAHITQEVNSFLLKNPSILRCMYIGIVNTRALAMLIKESADMDASPHAIISAIRRFNIDERKVKFDAIGNVLRNSKISTKSRLVFVTLSRDFSSLARTLPLVFKSINPSVGELLRIVEGRESIKILIDQSKKEQILSMIAPGDIKDITENLAEINIHFGNGYEDVTGIRAAILNELGINRIDVDETISCLPEFMLLLREKDIGRAHDALLTFFYR
ncbi:MAG: hypothetical protein ABH879_02680 [archaeon]